MNQYMAELIQGYLREPGEGLLSKLVNDQDGPDGAMTPVEAASNGFLMLVAGHDSTVNTIAHCVLTLLRNPESLDLLRERPELIPRRSRKSSAAVGRSVLPEPQRDRRHRNRRHRHPEGLGGAPAVRRREPRPGRRPDPEKFDIQRPDNQHVGWGRGVHSCVGGPLARLEVNLALENFLRRVENPRLVVDPPPYRQNQIFRGPLHLEVEFDRITDEAPPSRPSSSSNGNSRANSGTCRCPSPDPGRYW